MMTDHVAESAIDMEMAIDIDKHMDLDLTSKKFFRDTRVNFRFWTDFASMLLVISMSEACRGIVLPTLSKLVSTIGGGSAALGLVVATFSIGRLACSYVFGKLMDRYNMGPRRIFQITLLISLVGGTIYVLCPSAYNGGSGAMVLLVLSRLLTGFGTGVLSVARSWLSQNTTLEQRTRFMAVLGIAQFFGATLTPMVGGLDVQFMMGSLPVTQLTFGSWLLVIVDAFLLIVIPLAMTSGRSHAITPPSETDVPDESAIPDATHETDVVPGPDADAEHDPSMHEVPLATGWVATWLRPRLLHTLSWFTHAVEFFDTNRDLVVCILLNGALRGSQAVAEAYGTNLYLMAFWRDSADGITDAGTFFTCIGVFGCIIFLSTEHIQKRTGPFKLLVSALWCNVMGFFMLITFGEQMAPWRFVTGCVMIWGIANPLVQTVILSLFSQRLTIRGYQTGQWMAWFTMVGSVGRILLPLVAGGFYACCTSGAAFLCTGLVVFSSTIYVSTRKGMFV